MVSGEDHVPRLRSEDREPAAEILSVAEGAAFLARYGLPLVAQTLARTGEEAENAARGYGGAVALKLVAKGLSHKSDVGGVRLGVNDAAEVRRHAAELLAAGHRMGDCDALVLIQPMVRGLVELIVGIAEDRTFGPVVAVGLGGTLTEFFEDIAIRIPPLTRDDALDLLGETRTLRLLEGFRGNPPADKDAVVEVILAASRIALDGEVSELDLNPVIVLKRGAGCVIVDNRVVRGDRAAAPDRNRIGRF